MSGGGGALSLNTDSPLVVTGICLAIGGNLIISFGLNGQKWVHNQNAGLSEAERRPYTKQPLWWLGFTGTVVGEVLNFLAFGFAGAAIVTPLGAVNVVANAVIACTLLGEQFRVRDLLGVSLTVVGSVLVVLAAPAAQRDVTVARFLELATGGMFVAYLACVLAAVVAIYRLLPRVQHTHPAWGLLLCSLLGTLTVLCATALSNFVRLSASGSPQFGHAVPYGLLLLMVGSAVGQVRYLNETMERFDNTTVVPVFYMLFTLCTVTGSAMLYQDFYDQPAPNVALFLLGCAQCFGGVVLLTSGRGGRHAAHAPPRGSGGHVQLGAVRDVELPDMEAPGSGDNGGACHAARHASAAPGAAYEGEAGQPLSRLLSASLDGFHAASQRGLVDPAHAQGVPLPAWTCAPGVPSGAPPGARARAADGLRQEPKAGGGAGRLPPLPSAPTLEHAEAAADGGEERAPRAAAHSAGRALVAAGAEDEEGQGGRAPRCQQ